ncbi:hypothetical protein QC762_0025920 [Podospora pseudocomata]|uniref:Uncharacterized protein n=1 Tax=Podospora pseudocomata TaxID=2093779 RepID=A0ABR0GRN7_9PEZI|nr:hypothetical protein QC762_0025920 [Podospora pseudocomata]
MCELAAILRPIFEISDGKRVGRQDHQEHQEPKTWIGWLRAPNPVEHQASTATTTWRPSRTNVKPQSLSFLAAVAGNPH